MGYYRFNFQTSVSDIHRLHCHENTTFKNGGYLGVQTQSKVGNNSTFEYNNY